MTVAERERKIAQNKEKYGLSKQEIDALHMPKKRLVKDQSGGDVVLTYE